MNRLYPFAHAGHRVVVALLLAVATQAAACSGSSDDPAPDAGDAGSGADTAVEDAGDATADVPDADDTDVVVPDTDPPERPEGTVSVPGTTESRSNRFRLLTASGPSTRAAASSGRFRLVRALHSDVQVPQ